jgi:hypothetical protein
MDLGGLEVLDVAIGLVALFFLLSTALASINEGIANFLGWRAKTLEDALRSLVDDPKAKQGLKSWIGLIDKPEEDKPVAVEPGKPVITTLWTHWRMKALVRDPGSPQRRRARPSYLPPRAFSLALAETLAAGAPTKTKPPEKRTDDDIFDDLVVYADKLPPGQLKEIIGKAAVNAENKFERLEVFRAQVEHLFDDSMERASGWYKRKVQFVLAVLAALVVIGLNVDTVRVATSLWNDAAVRDAVSTVAAEAESPESAAKAIDAVEELGLPVGWGANAPDNVFKSIPGWIIAIAALNLGAPFWFDLLSRLARLRGSGLQERPRALSDTTATERGERAPVVPTATTTEPPSDETPAATPDSPDGEEAPPDEDQPSS